MTQLVLQPTEYAYGGSVVAQDKEGRPVFVQGALPGETVVAELTVDKERFAHAFTVSVLEPSPQRITPLCPHYGTCGGCHYQHVNYPEQLVAKQLIVGDQLRRIGGLNEIPILPTLPSPQPWEYAYEAVFSPAAEGTGLGYWSPQRREVVTIDTCPITQSDLMTLYSDIDLELPGLRRLTLRMDSEHSMLAALEVDDVEAPELAVDFPISVSIVLPDKTSASLIGEPFLIYRVKGREFRVSPGCFFYTNLTMAGELINTVLDFAALTGEERVLELYSGVGLLTAFLAERAAEISAVEVNDDAIEDMIINLNHLDNVTLYHGLAEEVLPEIGERPEVIVVDPGRNGLAQPVLRRLGQLAAPRIVYVGSDLARVARDGRALTDMGYQLVKIQPLDMHPQTYHIDTVGLWEYQG